MGKKKLETDPRSIKGIAQELSEEKGEEIGPSVIRRLLQGARYVWKRMREKGVALDRLRSALGDAFAELREKMPFAWESELHLSNVLVLDFDPKTNKPLLAFIDHGFSVQTHVNK
jgi:hypothetical protein